MRSILLVCLFAAAAFAAEWLTSYDEAFDRAIAENKPVLVVLMRQSCPYCRQLISETLPQPAIDRVISENFIALMLDTEENPKEVMRARLRANAVPASFIIGADGRQQNMLIGYAPPMTYMRFLQQN
ncbi:hypothetical protein AGMMS50229_12780 [Campylobacterota bacterium]|nr:hypothetical protein AGMMS50229_12780 [Campylobacterota bacterium]